MKKVIFRHSAVRMLVLSVSLFFSFNTLVLAQDADIPGDQADPQENVAGPQEGNVEAATGSGDAAAGKSLFNSLCAACHKLDANSIGPPLRGITAKRDQQWLKEWIRNSQALIASGDDEAVAIYNEYNQVAMPPFPQLSDADIDNILAYTSEEKKVPEAKQPGADAAGAGGGAGGVSTDIVLGILAFVLLMLLVILYLVNKTLRRFATASGVELPVGQKRTPIWRSFVQNQFLVLVTSVILLLVAGYAMYGYFMQVGIDQGYQPVQPIHFSHKIHAGDNQIECKFCHSSARVSKTSGIPSLNVCMNCHKSIGEVAEETATEEYSKDFYDKEIQKLYAAVGWDPAAQAYTGEQEPVKWVRIHNLPDFAYFNHSQHVEVGGIACQTCHGPVQEMEIMYQDAPLTMGWCVNCHRETNVKMEGNEYYEKIHSELSQKYGVEELTVAQMGGIECMKCHY
ncbi:c-type cytochrome [Antarcticibacterium flavum]|uniref:C-type cytochrome n=1 Tax=Antarcticibacterium flavum TaxID=2058175 RepID=A0A5B7X3Z2_9FLAO|nr:MULTISPECIES: c-type cytochrome [Antarcticibacterium]MCM4158343.1 cytochrome C [Antarcticibacterium sp. W02-3]QCY70107.1 c-type cytochrome [Antarcticibacterium flavum]